MSDSRGLALDEIRTQIHQMFGKSMHKKRQHSLADAAFGGKCNIYS